VVALVFSQFGVQGKRQLEDGIKRTRLVPDEQGQMMQTAIWETFDPEIMLRDVKRIYAKIQGHEAKYGMDKIDPVALVENPVWPVR
jgi:acyl-[acyl-carrier-protein] desaturase